MWSSINRARATASNFWTFEPAGGPPARARFAFTRTQTRKQTDATFRRLMNAFLRDRLEFRPSPIAPAHVGSPCTKVEWIRHRFLRDIQHQQTVVVLAHGGFRDRHDGLRSPFFVAPRLWNFAADMSTETNISPVIRFFSSAQDRREYNVRIRRPTLRRSNHDCEAFIGSVDTHYDECIDVRVRSGERTCCRGDAGHAWSRGTDGEYVPIVVRDGRGSTSRSAGECAGPNSQNRSHPGEFSQTPCSYSTA